MEQNRFEHEIVVSSSPEAAMEDEMQIVPNDDVFEMQQQQQPMTEMSVDAGVGTKAPTPAETAATVPNAGATAKTLARQRQPKQPDLARASVAKAGTGAAKGQQPTLAEMWTRRKPEQAAPGIVPASTDPLPPASLVVPPSKGPAATVGAASAGGSGTGTVNPNMSLPTATVRGEQAASAGPPATGTGPAAPEVAPASASAEASVTTVARITGAAAARERQQKSRRRHAAVSPANPILWALECGQIDAALRLSPLLPMLHLSHSSPGASSAFGGAHAQRWPLTPFTPVPKEVLQSANPSPAKPAPREAPPSAQPEAKKPAATKSKKAVSVTCSSNTKAAPKSPKKKRPVRAGQPPAAGAEADTDSDAEPKRFPPYTYEELLVPPTYVPQAPDFYLYFPVKPHGDEVEPTPPPKPLYTEDLEDIPADMFPSFSGDPKVDLKLYSNEEIMTPAFYPAGDLDPKCCGPVPSDDEDPLPREFFEKLHAPYERAEKRIKARDREQIKYALHKAEQAAVQRRQEQLNARWMVPAKSMKGMLNLAEQVPERDPTLGWLLDGLVIGARLNPLAYMQEMTPEQVRAANKFRVVGDFSGEPYRVQIALRRLKEISETGRWPTIGTSKEKKVKTRKPRAEGDSGSDISDLPSDFNDDSDLDVD